MLTTKQRAQLRALANNTQTVLHIGKDGITDNVIRQAQDALKARELIKCQVLENAKLDARQACDRLSELCGAQQVQVIGKKFVLYKRNPENPRISLGEDGKG